MNAVFANRWDAGKKLAQQLIAYKDKLDAIVLALPRGGVPVGHEVAKKLNLSLDVCLVRKLGLPDCPETAMGAIAEDALLHNYGNNITIIDRDTIQTYKVDKAKIQAITAKEKAKLRWRESCYRSSRSMLTITNRTVIIVDDGMATGMTMHAAIEVLKKHQPAKIIVAIPVASPQAIAKIENLVDALTCLVIPKSFSAVGFWYEDFSQISDQEVCNLLDQQTCDNHTGTKDIFGSSTKSCRVP